MSKQFRNVCWTLFTDYSEDKEQAIMDTWTEWTQTKYVVFQFEQCPTTQKVHVQGYTEFKGGVRLQTLQNKFPGIHVEARRGTAEEAAEYCKKEDTRLPNTHPSEEGICSKGKGNRSDLHNVVELVKEGKTMREVAEADGVSFVRHHRGLTALQTVLRLKKRIWKPTVMILWGLPGTGKTRYVYEKHGFENVYEVPTPRSGSEVWFDGYQGHEVLLIDDFYGWIRWSFLLKLIDRYPQDLPVKGIT